MNIFSLNNALELAQSEKATIVDWYRGDFSHTRGVLNIYCDNIPEDAREVYTIELARAGYRCTVARLSGYDHKANKWTRHIAARESVEISKKGEKALRAWLADCAVKLRGAPNPEQFSIYPNDRKTISSK